MTNDGSGGVTQRQFYEALATTKKDILTAIDKVGDGVQDNAVEIGKLGTKLEDFDRRIGQNEKAIEGIRGDLRQHLIKAAGSGGLTGTLAGLLLRLVEFLIEHF